MLNLQHQHLQSFHHLVAATNILSSFKASNAGSDEYTNHYVQYRKSIQALFPHVHSKPNHHYAMHNGALLKYLWMWASASHGMYESFLWTSNAAKYLE
jgi:hypothetical protein